MKITHAAAAVAALVLAAGDVALAQSSFDCRRPRSEAAATICATPQLAEQDIRVDAAYRRALQSAAEPNRVRDNHSAWANSLSICGADRQCLAELLDEELETLEYASRTIPEVDELAPSIPVAEVSERAEPAMPLPTTQIEPLEPKAEQGPVESLSPAEPPPAAVEPEPTVAGQAASPKAERTVAVWEKAAFGGLLLIPVLAVVLALLATKSLAEHTSRRFNWPLIMNWWNVLYLVGIFGGLFVATFAGPAGGLGLLGAICLVMLVVNVIKTNLLTGLAMTLVQPLVVVIMWLGYCLARGQVQGRRP